MIRDLIFAAIGSAAVAVIMHAPGKTIAFCGICGGLCYVLCNLLTAATTLFLAHVCAAFLLMLSSRVLAYFLKTPSLTFLVSAIFPLVPGAGIYYCAYYLMQQDIPAFSARVMQVLTIALALAIGIVAGSAIPLAKKEVK